MFPSPAAGGSSPAIVRTGASRRGRRRRLARSSSTGSPREPSPVFARRLAACSADASAAATRASRRGRRDRDADEGVDAGAVPALLRRAADGLERRLRGERRPAADRRRHLPRRRGRRRADRLRRLEPARPPLHRVRRGRRDARLLDPATEPARIRAMFVRSDWTRRGLGRAILEACEAAARSEGFTSLSLMATLPGVPAVRAATGSRSREADVPVRMPDGVVIPCAAMAKPIAAGRSVQGVVADDRATDPAAVAAARPRTVRRAERRSARHGALPGAHHPRAERRVRRRDGGALRRARLGPVGRRAARHRCVHRLRRAQGRRRTTCPWRRAPRSAGGWRTSTGARASRPRAARAAVAYGFEQLGLDEIVSFTASSNVPSRRVMEKLGMQEDVAAGFDHPRFPDWPGRYHVVYRLPGP